MDSKIFELSLNLSLTNSRAQIACYELKGGLSLVMLNKIFHDSFENVEFKDLYGKPWKCDWMAKVVFLIQMLATFSGRCNRYFWDSGYLGNFDMLFTLVLTKFSKSELFSCLPKVDHVIKSWKEPIHVHVPCTCMLRNMMAHVTTFGIVLHNIIMIANVRIWIRVILRLKKIIIRNPPSVLSTRGSRISF